MAKSKKDEKPDPKTPEKDVVMPAFVACPGGKPPAAGEFTQSEFLGRLQEANTAAMQHMDSQSQLQVAMAVLTIASHCEHLSAKFEETGILDQATAIVKVMLFTGPLAQKVRHNPADETLT